MMREPKFRGFSTETNSWHYGHGWFEIDYTDDYLKEKGINQRAMFYTEGYPVECELSSMGEYTGLNDKNQNPIYEGDVVRTLDGEVGEIIFKNGKFIRKINSEWGQELIYQVEVIGNLYENPSLLEVNK